VILVRHERRGAYSPSAVVWHVGVRGVPEVPAAHHNVHFGEEWSTSFNALSRGRLMPDPSRLVSIPSLGRNGGRHALRAGSHFRPDRPFRPSNVERPPSEMFFAGSGIVPGVGVPMLLIPGKLAANRVAPYPAEWGR
jgi:phytoene dehydrogenase-like protein